MHTLVSRALRFHEKSAPERVRALRSAAVEAVKAEFLVAGGHIVGLADPRFYMAHALELVGARQLAGWRLQWRRGMILKVLDSRTRALGPEHPGTFLAGRLLAESFLTEIDRRLHEQTLIYNRRLEGPEHPLTLRSMTRLGATMSQQGDLAEAHELLDEALRLQRSVLGPDNPDTVATMMHLAAVLHAQNDLTGARKLQEEALAVRRRLLGAEHPETLASMLVLAETIAELGDLPMAREIRQEVLEVDRRLLGPEHPNTLTSMQMVADTLHDQGELVQACDLRQEALEVSRRVSGPEAPDTCICAWNLFRVLHDLNKVDAATEILQRDLIWLLDREPASLNVEERKIRELLVPFYNRFRQAWKKEIPPESD